MGKFRTVPLKYELPLRSKPPPFLPLAVYVGEPPFESVVLPETLLTPSDEELSKFQYPTNPFVPIVPEETELTAREGGAAGVVAGVVAELVT